MRYLGRATTVAQLIKLLDNIHITAGLEISGGLNSTCPCVEVWYDHEIDSVILK
jgi:hypothetical protein